MGKVKVITLRQPWAELVVLGAKKIETRGWNTTFRGELFVHSSAKVDYGDLDLINQSAHYQRHIPNPMKLIYGAIIGKVDVVNSMRVQKLPPISEQERAFGDYAADRFGWLLSNAAKFAAPIYTKGALSIWEFDMPEQKEVHHG